MTVHFPNHLQAFVPAVEAHFGYLAGAAERHSGLDPTAGRGQGTREHHACGGEAEQGRRRQHDGPDEWCTGKGC